MQRNDLEAMTKDELRDVAEAQGLPLEANDTKGTMVDKILGEYVAPLVAKKTVPARKDEKLPAIGRLRTLDGALVDGRKYRLTIFVTENDKSDVDLIVNGHNLRIRRGVEVIVDEAYIEVLRNAVIDTVIQDPETGARSAARMMVYPHQAIPL